MPQLQRTRSDIAVYFLSAQDILFESEVDDPWYSSHTYTTEAIDSATGTVIGRLYVADKPVNAIACATQEQYCTSESSKGGRRCGPQHGHYTKAGLMEKLDKQEKLRFLAIADYFMNLLSTPDRMAATVGPLALLARATMAFNIQGGLPRDQWQKEMENFASMHLAHHQNAMLFRVKGPTTPEIAKFWVKPAQNETHYRSLCDNQVWMTLSYAPKFNMLTIFRNLENYQPAIPIFQRLGPISHSNNRLSHHHNRVLSPVHHPTNRTL